MISKTIIIIISSSKPKEECIIKTRCIFEVPVSKDVLWTLIRRQNNRKTLNQRSLKVELKISSGVKKSDLHKVPTKKCWNIRVNIQHNWRILCLLIFFTKDFLFSTISNNSPAVVAKRIQQGKGNNERFNSETSDQRFGDVVTGREYGWKWLSSSTLSQIYTHPLHLEGNSFYYVLFP